MTGDISTATERASLDIPHTFSSFLCSNSCPSIEASSGIKSLIEEHEHQLATIEHQVEHLKKRLSEMEHRQVQTRDTLVKLHATLAPIKRLPPELLSEIFEHAVDVGNPRVFSMTARAKVAPLLLGRVCRAWRGVTLATPRLWRDIFVNVCDGRYSSEMRRDALPVLQTWLAHSGSLPLSLVILCKTERVLPGLVDLFETIAAHATRWKTVYIRLQNSSVIFRLVCRAFTGCTSLSTFDVTDGGQCVSYFGNQRLEVGEQLEVHPVRFDLSLAPLNQLSLSLAGLTIRDVGAPWARLTRLTFMNDARSSTSSITDYMSILRQCISLKECSIAIDNAVRDTPLEPFTLPNLECLHFQMLREAAQTTQLGDFLSMLNAPRLSAFAIDDYCPRRETVLYHSPLKAFLQTHGQSLRHFRLATSSKFFSSEDMIALLVEMPLLTELEYHPDEESSPKALLEALTPRTQGDGVDCLLPCLERLFVYWDTRDTVSMVGDMIEKRYAMAENGIARLRYLSCKPVKVSIVYDCMPPHLLVENLAARLEPFCKCGSLEVDWEAYRYDLEFLYC